MDPLFVFASMNMANKVGVEVKYRDENCVASKSGFILIYIRFTILIK